MNSEFAESSLFEVDWTNISSESKREILEHHIHYINVSRRTVGASGAYLANFRTLVMILLVAMSMSLSGFENRTIVLTIASLQFAKTILARLFEASMFTALDIARKDFSKFLKRKLLT